MTIKHAKLPSMQYFSTLKQPLSKRLKIGLQDQLSLNAGQKYCRMQYFSKVLQNAILSTFIRLPFVIRIFVLSIFEGPFYTGFNVINGLADSILFSSFSIIFFFTYAFRLTNCAAFTYDHRQTTQHSLVITTHPSHLAIDKLPSFLVRSLPTLLISP